MAATSSAADRGPEPHLGVLKSKLADLRSRLLNLSLTNKLLNFRHSDRARGFVRVVDELPDALFEKLSKGPMVFQPLPPIDAEPADERTDAFKMAVDAARLTDEAYIAAMTKLEAEGDRDDAGEAAERIERDLKDRVRVELGLPPRPRDGAVALAEHARLHGISPSFDLPTPNGGGVKDGWRDREIQLLLLPETAERKLSAVLDLTNEHLQETGINTLYAAFGFLQWYEDANSDRPLFAPLLLLPLAIKRELRNHAYLYSVAATGDEAEINLSLKEKLKRDFGLALPELEDEDTPESYFRRVAEAIAQQPRWKIRRWVTVGIFPFARMAMYHDLDPDRWPEGRGPLEHDVVGDMLIGREGPEGDAIEHDIDDPVVAESLPPLITDADSSQLSAILEALERKALVIKGPPGTGKSQTITNLIAAALSRGERVLFVAEKLAALSVVHSRLEAAGLAPFCLELHSEKARRADVLKTLKARLDLRPLKKPAELDRKLKELRRTRDELNRYAKAMNAPFGRSGMTVHEVFWAAQRAQSEAGDLPEKLTRMLAKNPDAISPETIERARSMLAGVEEAYAELARTGRDPATHPWRGVAKSPITPFDVKDIGDAVDAWLRAAEALREALDALATESGWVPADTTLSGLDAFETALGLAKRPLDAVRAELAAALRAEDVRQAARDFLARQKALAETEALLAGRLGEAFRNPERREALRDLEQEAARLDVLAMTPAALRAEIDRLEAERAGLGALVAAGRELALAFGHQEEPTVEDFSRFLNAARHLAEVPREVLALRLRPLLDESVRPIITDAAETARRLRERQQALEEIAYMDRESEPDLLDTHAAVLRRAGRFAVFSGEFRRARRFCRDLARRHLTVPVAMAGFLERIARHVRERRKFESDTRLAAICGHHFNGLKTDFDRLLEVCSFADAVRDRHAGVAPAAQRIRTTLLEADNGVLAEILGLVEACESLETLCAGRSAETHLSDLTEAADARLAALRALAERARAEAMPETGFSFAEIPGFLDGCSERDETRAALDGDAAMRALLGDAFAGADTDTTGLAETIDHVERVESAEIPAALRERLTAPGLKETARLLANRLPGAIERRNALAAAFNAAIRAAGLEAAFFDGLHFRDVPLSTQIERLGECLADPDGLMEWSAFADALGRARDANLGHILDAFLEERRPLEGLFPAYRHVVYRSMARRAYELDDGLLARHSGLDHEALRGRFQELDREILLLNRRKLASDLLARPIPEGVSRGKAADLTERALIEREAQKSRRHIPLRELIRRAGGAIQAAKPCFMMSPLSIAQYIPPGSIEFDLLIIDEASQMRPEEAIGAFARAERAVVVGDPMQLPPTSFFSRSLEAPSEDAEEEEEKIANESILDLALAAFRPAHLLRWHYRSRHGGLIAFSNRRFYDDGLIVFPSPWESHPEYGVQYRHVNGLYRSGTNLIEAQAVAEAAIAFMHRHPDQSLGVVALNQTQRELILEEMERRIAQDDRAAAYVERWANELEPFFVKNLENVQGDERDVIMISTVYGPEAPGRPVRRFFGPINGAAGHRRLNVLFTRAKRRTIVYSSMRPDQIRIEPGSSRGLKALKGYLEYAATGRLEGGEVTGRAPDSDFEVWVAEQLEQMGCEAVPQVGVAGYFIDIGVRHPAYPHGFLLGIECDGAAYHASKSARDRDRLRQSVLEGLQWEIHRIWSTDWFRNPNGEVEKLRRRIETLLAEKTARLESETEAAD